MLGFLKFLFDVPGTEGTGATLPVEDKSTLEILNEDAADELIPIPEPEIESGEKEGDIDREGEGEPKEEPKEEEIEIEDTEPKLDEEEIETISPRRGEILKAYPDLFKKFPEVERAIYRERKYGEYFPTLKDASDAAEKSQYFDRYQQEILNGNVEPILQIVKQSNPQAFGKVVDSYLELLDRVDPNARLHVISKIGKQVVAEMGIEGQRTNNDTLKAASVILHQFLFGSSAFQPVGNFSKEQPQTNPEFENQRAQFINNQFNTVATDLYARASNSIKATIDKHIDPKNAMPEFVKTKAIEEAMQLTEKAIVSDTRFAASLARLWEEAYRTNFSQESRDKLLSAYRSKAKTILGSTIQKVRQQALAGLGQKREDKDRQGPLPRGTSAGQNSGKITKASQIPKNMSTREFLMRDDL